MVKTELEWEDFEFNGCEYCVHRKYEDGNPEFFGCCRNCIHNPEYADYFVLDKEKQII